MSLDSNHEVAALVSSALVPATNRTTLPSAYGLSRAMTYAVFVVHASPSVPEHVNVESRTPWSTRSCAIVFAHGPPTTTRFFALSASVNSLSSLATGVVIGTNSL